MTAFVFENKVIENIKKHYISEESVITKWHKVADGDYPPCEKGNHTINVLTDCGNIAYYNYDEECWVAEPASAETEPPIAWCEIPKYKE